MRTSPYRGSCGSLTIFVCLALVGDGVGDGVGSPVYRPSPGLEPGVLVAGKRAVRARFGQSESEPCSDRNVVRPTTRQDTLSSHCK